jgi:catechol 2,3-dioxygenase-like lactoylglutathione lyase family enzyme
MLISGLLHVAVKTNDLDATTRFYTEVLGLALAPRPDFGFPGAWIAVPTPVGEAVIHVYAGGPALGREGRAPEGTGAIDHLALAAYGWDETIERLRRHGLDWRENIVPGTSLWQIFVYDPSGVQLELTYDGRAEKRPAPEIPPERRYRAGESFFRARAPAAAD